MTLNHWVPGSSPCGRTIYPFLYSKDKTNASSMLLAINCNKVLAASDKFL